MDGAHCVKAFGAVGDGIADDSNAVQNAFSAISTAGGAIEFPAGTYRLTRKIVLRNRNVSIIGACRELSILRWEDTRDGGFAFRFDAQDHCVTVRSLTLRTAVSGGGTAVHVMWPELIGAPGPNASRGPQLHVEDFQVTPELDQHHYWNKGLLIENGCGLKISQFSISGRANHRVMKSGIELVGQTVAVCIESGNICSVATGLVAPQTEALYVNHVEVVDADEGLRLAAGAQRRSINSRQADDDVAASVIEAVTLLAVATLEALPWFVMR
jgi:hypothetical protein